MKQIFKSSILACLVALASTSVQATCQRVVQNGTVINGAPVVFLAECLIARAGGSAGSTIVNGLPMITDLGVMGPFGILDAPITGAYHQGLFKWMGNNLVIGVNSYGGAGTPNLCMQINGGVLTCGFGGGGGGGGFPFNLGNTTIPGTVTVSTIDGLQLTNSTLNGAVNGAPNYTGTPTYAALSSGTPVVCLGLDSTKHLITTTCGGSPTSSHVLGSGSSSAINCLGTGNGSALNCLGTGS